MRISVLALNGVFDTGLAGVIDVFTTANELAPLTGLASVRFDVSIVGVRRTVKTAQGFSVPVAEVGRRLPDVAIVPALGTKMPEPLELALSKPEIGDAAQTLRRWAKAGVLMSAACIGTFVMAEAGLLDDHDATTTWWLAPFFRRRYPLVALDESRMIVKSERVVTSGAALGPVDLALWLVRQQSPELATLTARYLIVDPRPTQVAYALTEHLSHSDPLVERFEKWARGQLKRGFSLDDAARAVGASPRTLGRRIQQVLGRSPLGYVQDLRVERAVHLLRTTDLSMDDIASRVGYADTVSLRALLRRRLGKGVRELRRTDG